MNTAILDEILDPVSRCLTPEVARMIVEMRASPATQARLDELAEKSTEGKLTPAERERYETYVRAIDFVTILQLKARRVLADSATG